MNKKLWTWIIAVFAVFAAVMLAVELRSEQSYKKAVLSSRLEGYADVVAASADSFTTVSALPDNIRVTVVKTDGSVVYDSYEDTAEMGNHLSRPEIASCLDGEDGCEIRKSETAGIEYIYYARRYGNLIIRTALPFELQQRRFMHPDWVFVFSMALLFLAMSLIIVLISNKYNKEINKATDEKLQTQKKSMTNNLAHELRTPVTSVRGYLETLVDNPDMASDKRALFTERAYLQTLRLSDLIRDISLITKIEEAPELLVKEHLGLRRISEEVFDEFANDIAEHGIKVENLIADDVTVKGNQSLLYAIIRNLVENSIRYAGDDVTIHIECSSVASSMLHVNYYDTGKGVSEEYLSKIFERFYRIPSEDAHRAEGSGLGLSIVKNAVAFHGGTISASNIQPHGLCFRFTLSQI